jgi:hypothetical protein
MKTKRDRTCELSPAIMIYRPALPALLLVAVAAIPPPAPCSSKAVKSELMKMAT